MHQKNHAPNHRFLFWHAGCTARSCTGEKAMVWSWRSLSLRHWNAGWNFQVAINSQLVALENLTNPTIQHPTCIFFCHWIYENFASEPPSLASVTIWNSRVSSISVCWEHREDLPPPTWRHRGSTVVPRADPAPEILPRDVYQLQHRNLSLKRWMF